MSFYLGKTGSEPFDLEAKDLCTHAVCMGMTGSGKTGLGIGLLEEAALDKIPAIIIDPKGDLGNLMLAFPNLDPSDFEPWVDPAEAERQGLSLADFAAKVADDWKKGLKSWGEDPKKIQDYKDAVERTIYTPANPAGVQISILNSFAAPSDEVLNDIGSFRDRILSTTSSLLGLIGIDADPLKSKEHILISAILENLWKDNQSLDLPSLIRYIQNPPFKQVGVFDLDTFLPQKERLNLAMMLNNLLASPGFQAWMEGEPLDIQNLLYSASGKPRHSIIYIAHLSDRERMFFITLLLNEVISWMRTQSGTSSLRALLYMDEIFGFFPSVSNPPSKTPMISLLKQARAYGLGVVLATQNPIDLDYRGLGNAGTWFIGKLQTERDRMRIIDGLQSSSNGDMNTTKLNELLSECKKRVFLVQSIHKQTPLLFETRWTLSYLCGPLTLPQISQLTGKKTKTIIQETQSTAKPLLPAGIQEYTLKSATANSTFMPFILGKGKLHFVDANNRCDLWANKIIMAPLSDDGKDVDWQEGDFLPNLDTLTTVIPKDGSFGDIPPPLLSPNNYKTFSKSLFQFLYQNATLELNRVDALHLTSKLDESEAEFRKRATEAALAKADESISRMKATYQSKIETLKEKIKRAEASNAQKQDRAGKKKMDAWISVGKTILSGIFSSKKLSKTTITDIGTSLKKVGSMSDDEVSEEGIRALQTQVDEFTKIQETEINKIKEAADYSKLPLDKLSIRPRKTDLVIESISILWKPLPSLN